MNDIGANRMQCEFNHFVVSRMNGNDKYRECCNDCNSNTHTYTHTIDTTFLLSIIVLFCSNREDKSPEIVSDDSSHTDTGTKIQT